MTGFDKETYLREEPEDSEMNSPSHVLCQCHIVYELWTRTKIGVHIDLRGKLERSEVFCWCRYASNTPRERNITIRVLDENSELSKKWIPGNAGRSLDYSRPLSTNCTPIVAFKFSVIVVYVP
ncbi:hypothetical protein QCA50_020337 [Cerrena zonata]|uniref:Uncharacterized protein n=1 Tax=Cerrena zonata TaxID=2478898 RepID=A0AAW0FJ95_9APHY